jgi:protein TonB
VLTHAGGFLLIAVVASRLPLDSEFASITTDPPTHITWIQPGAGGGNDGSTTPGPPRRAELAGRDALTVPVSQPRRSAPELTTDPREVEQPLEIPAVSAMAGVQELPGAVSALIPVSSADLQGAGSGDRGGQRSGSGSGSGVGPGLGPGRYGGTGGDGYPSGSGVTPPRLIREIKPGYTPAAMRARIQGMVTLQAMVLPDGSVGTAHVIRSLDSTFGLDQEAVRTVKQWRFVPGTLAGRAVAVIVEIELNFTLR